MQWDSEKWWYLLVAGFVGGLASSYLQKKDVLGYIVSCIVGAFTSLFFGSSLAIWSHNYFNLYIPLEEYLSGCGFLIGLVAMVISDKILKKVSAIDTKKDKENK